MRPRSPFNELRRLVAPVLLLLAACGRPELVEDGAGLLSEGERRRIAEFHGLLQDDHGIDYRVATGRALGDIEKTAADRFARLEIGGAGGGGQGLLLLVDTDAARVRLEVGRSLEGIYTDAFIAYVEQRQMVPFFASGRIADGILATTELIVQRAIDAKASADAPLGAGPALSGGGGATAAVGAGAPAGAQIRPSAAAAGNTPEETLAAYFALLRERDAGSEHDLYTSETRAMLRGWAMTPAQADMVLRAYRRCRADPARTDPAAGLAVIRYRIQDRECAPWFFVKDGAVWRLDLAAMQQAVRFGRNNEWRFAPGAGGRYGFAFEDWRFDANGFPRSAGG